MRPVEAAEGVTELVVDVTEAIDLDPIVEEAEAGLVLESAKIVEHASSRSASITRTLSA